MRPRAFQIRDFKSIENSGICNLSGDSITVLAGQNVAGKTAVLTALRDFDLEEGAAPKTADYQPEDRLDAVPSVSVQFEADQNAVLSALLEENLTLPQPVIERLRADSTLWINRDLRTGK